MTSLQALKDMPISFPGLFGDWEFNPDPIAIHVGHGIYWYGIILAAAMLAGLLLCMKQAKRYGIKGAYLKTILARPTPGKLHKKVQLFCWSCRFFPPPNRSPFYVPFVVLSL